MASYNAPENIEWFGHSPSDIYQSIQIGYFSKRRVLETEAAGWLAAQIGQRTDDRRNGGAL
jgi:hypothetical protein